MKQVARVHLAALGVDPDAATFDMHMTVPSYVFELAQLEVRNGQAQLAQALGELMPKPWILQHIFGFSQDEAIYTTKTKATEVSTAAKQDAATQAEIMRVYPEVAIGVPPSMMGAMGMGGEDEGMGEEAAPAAPAPATTKEDVGDLKRRLAVLLGENARVLRLVESLDHKVDDMAASERKRARRMRVIGGE
jgi:hypothetical protein